MAAAYANASSLHSPEIIAKRHETQKLTAMERVALLCDAGTFRERDALVEHSCSSFGMDRRRIPGDGFVTGVGEVHGRPVYLFSHDALVFGGSLSAANAQKVVKLMDEAGRVGAPIVGINDSGGARVQEGVDSLAGYADLFFRNTVLSGVVPQISLIAGPCAGGAVYSPAITDFTFMVNSTAYMFVTGPDVVESVGGKAVSKEQLGGASVHATKSGVSSGTFRDEICAFSGIRRLLTYLPQSNREKPPRIVNGDPADRRVLANQHIVPNDPKESYDMRDVVTATVDRFSFYEIQPTFAKNIVCGFARFNGNSVCIIANQPMSNAGALDIDASVKAARLVRFADAFNIPIVTFVDVPGFLPGVSQEYGGIIRHGAKLLFAYAEATVPKITVITRKAYGGAYDVMSSKHIGADCNYAWPTAQVAVMGAEGAAKIVRPKNDLRPLDERIAEYEAQFCNPLTAARRGFIDAVIDPTDTRRIICEDLQRLSTKVVRRPECKHSNIPL